MSNFFVDWFFQQDEFTTDIEEMNEEELNKCLRFTRTDSPLIGTCATSHTTSHFR